MCKDLVFANWVDDPIKEDELANIIGGSDSNSPYGCYTNVCLNNERWKENCASAICKISA